jgi:hypothetical protein
MHRENTAFYNKTVRAFLTRRQVTDRGLRALAFGAVVGRVWLERHADELSCDSARPINKTKLFARSRGLLRRLPMLGTVAVWLALARDKRDVLMLGAFLLFTALATVIWNILP